MKTLCLFLIINLALGGIFAQAKSGEELEPNQKVLYDQKKEAIKGSFERLNATIEEYKHYYEKLVKYRGDHGDYMYGIYNNYDFVPDFAKNKLIIRLDVVDTMDNEYNPITYQRRVLMDLSGTKVSKMTIEVELADHMKEDNASTISSLVIDPANLDKVVTQMEWFHYKQETQVGDKDTPYNVKNKIMTKISHTLEETIVQVAKVIAAIQQRFAVDSAEQPTEFKDFMEIVR